MKCRMFYDAPSASSCVVRECTRIIDKAIDDDDARKKARKIIREMNARSTWPTSEHPEERFMLTGLAEIKGVKVVVIRRKREELRRFRFA